MRTQVNGRNIPFVILLVLLTLGMSACSHKQVKSGEEGTGSEPTAKPAIDEDTLGDSDSGKAHGLQTVHFAYDSSVLDSAAKAEIQANAEILKKNPSFKVQIQGHCDERGGIQYNIALGERRAKSVMHYLTGLGISANRLAVISYGKERPLDPGHTEEAWTKNRRANFEITSLK